MGTMRRGLVATLLCIGYGKNHQTPFLLLGRRVLRISLLYTFSRRKENHGDDPEMDRRRAHYAAVDVDGTESGRSPGEVEC